MDRDMAISMVLGIIALVLGLGLRYWINRRKFYRRSPTGAEGFSSYEKSVIVTFLERVGKWTAYALIIFGLLFLWSYSRQKKAKEKEEMPQSRTSTSGIMSSDGQPVLYMALNMCNFPYINKVGGFNQFV